MESKETGMSINTRKEGNPVVGIVGGSTSDFPILQKAVDLIQPVFSSIFSSYS
jgi:phosphoribosylcarboxyaminoimidazole (NCAIR) mutase